MAKELTSIFKLGSVGPIAFKMAEILSSFGCVNCSMVMYGACINVLNTEYFIIKINYHLTEHHEKMKFVNLCHYYTCT